MKDFGKRLEYCTIKQAMRALQSWRYETYGAICVHYKRYLDGGGSAFGQDYTPFLHDRVVGNPPHFDWSQIGEIRIADSGWRTHRRFFQTVDRFLKPGGVILIQENNSGSTGQTFREMIEEAGFSIVLAHNSEPRITPYTRYYYLGIVRRNETPPVWLGA